MGFMIILFAILLIAIIAVIILSDQLTNLSRNAKRNQKRLRQRRQALTQSQQAIHQLGQEQSRQNQEIQILHQQLYNLDQRNQQLQRWETMLKLRQARTSRPSATAAVAVSEIPKKRLTQQFISWPFEVYDRSTTQAALKGLAKNWYELTTPEFFHLCQQKQEFARDFDFTGIYLLHNTVSNKYYVGQGVSVLDCLYQHFSGSGDPDVYWDYHHGDTFTIQALALTTSQYYSLNHLEKDAMRAYHSNQAGYNHPNEAKK